MWNAVMWNNFQVEPDDDSTKICEKCFTTSSGLSKAKSLHNGVDRTISDVVVQSNETQDLENVGYLFIATDARNCCESIDSPVTCMFISLIGDETDSEKDKTKFDTWVQSVNKIRDPCSFSEFFQTNSGETGKQCMRGSGMFSNAFISNHLWWNWPPRDYWRQRERQCECQIRRWFFRLGSRFSSKSFGRWNRRWMRIKWLRPYCFYIIIGWS